MSSQVRFCPVQLFRRVQLFFCFEQLFRGCLELDVYNRDNPSWQENAADQPPLLFKGVPRGKCSGRKKQKRKLQAGSSDCWERDFFGSIVKALVSWQGQDARELGAKCSVGQHSASS